jgi:CRP/FNR family transcriptional regulator, cyclic AMP receptor protein
MKEIPELIDEIPALAGLDPAGRELIAGCGRNVVVPTGAHLFREGDAANTFYAIRRGRVALELVPPAGAPMVIETLDAPEVVGWSWLFPPHRSRFDARVIEELHAIAFDGSCLREKCESDHDLGFELMRRFAQIITDRLQATRLRLLDVFGPGVGSA